MLVVAIAKEALEGVTRKKAQQDLLLPLQKKHVSLEGVTRKLVFTA